MKAERVTPFLGLAALAVLAVVVNVFAGRHFTRWDWTSEKRYSLTSATVETLRELQREGAPLEVWVLLPSGDPLRLGLKQLLLSYTAETDRLDVRYLDPDREPVGYADVRRRFGLEQGKSSEGVIHEEAVAVVASKDRHWLITPSDLVHVAGPDDPRVKPRGERALTLAIRNVLAGEKSVLCFVTGQGELSVDDGGGEGVGFLRDILVRDNYEVKTVDLSTPAANEPLAGCDVAVVAGARTAFSERAAERLRSYLLAGGNALIGVSPINADTDTGMAKAGLDRVLAPFGVGLEDALVVETDGDRVFPGYRGIHFLAEPRAHAVTAALTSLGNSRQAPRIIVHFARPLRELSEPGASAPSPLLATSNGAFGVTNVRGAAEWSAAPEKTARDLQGPLTLAFASERPKLESQKDVTHGPRLVVIGTGSAFIETNWQLEGQDRGMALLVENAIGWLAAKPQVFSVPDKDEVAAGIRITEESRNEIFRYVLMYMPLATLALGLAMFFHRKKSEGAQLAKEKRPAKKEK